MAVSCDRFNDPSLMEVPKTCYASVYESYQISDEERHVRRLRWIVALWFSLFTALAIASPLLNPTSLDSVCSPEHGTRLIVVNDQGDDTKANLPSSDCPLCSGFFTPNFLVRHYFDAPSPLAHALEPQQEAFLIALSQPPLPSRGPPSRF